MSKKYKKSPIIEAVVEFATIPSSPWNITMPALLYDQIKMNFPDIVQREGPVQILTPASDGNPYKRDIDIVELVQFVNKSKNFLVQTGKNILTINAVKPYPTWEEYSPLVIDTFSKFQKLTKPKGFRRISLRYINILEVPSKTFKFEDYFNFKINKPSNLTANISHLNSHLEVKINSKDVFSQKIITSVAEDPTIWKIILEFEVIMNTYNGIVAKDVAGWLDNAHKIINETFEATISEKFRSSIS